MERIRRPSARVTACSSKGPARLRPPTDVVVVGAGLVGLATARALLRRGAGSVVVVDKEPVVGSHQSGHNSGVVHSGIYYRPGSAKAELVASGRERLLELCRDRGIAHEVCGKVVVATSTREMARLHDLQLRAEANGVAARLVDRAGLVELEPHAEGLAALHVPSTGIVDFGAVCNALADDVAAAGGQLRLGTEVRGVDERSGEVRVATTGDDVRGARVVNCAGLQSDRVAALAGLDTGGTRIVPFRGKYHELVPERRDLVRNLIYPVPDPRFPFLGVHVTRSVDGPVHVGPNAILALAREGYSWSDVDLDEVRELAASTAVHALVRRYWRTGAGEVVRSLSASALLRALRRVVPDVRAGDLRPGGSGVRAQAVAPDGTLLDDFVFAESPRIVSVVNAPSPAATACLAIADAIADRVGTRHRVTARSNQVR